jgi:hypothetical protein
MAGVGVDQSAGRRRGGRSTSPTAHSPGQLIEIVQGGVALGVHDQMHVLGAADYPQLGHALMGRDHQFHARTHGPYQPLSAFRVAGATRPEDRFVRFRRHRTVQAQRSGAGAGPAQRGLPLRRVVGQRHARVVVAALEHSPPVVGHRLCSHHPHPRHRPPPPSALALSPWATLSVATVLFCFWFIAGMMRRVYGLLCERYVEVNKSKSFSENCERKG